jgi:hypothetical protein
MSNNVTSLQGTVSLITARRTIFAPFVIIGLTQVVFALLYHPHYVSINDNLSALF